MPHRQQHPRQQHSRKRNRSSRRSDTPWVDQGLGGSVIVLASFVLALLVTPIPVPEQAPQPGAVAPITRRAAEI